MNQCDIVPRRIIIPVLAMKKWFQGFFVRSPTNNKDLKPVYGVVGLGSLVATLLVFHPYHVIERSESILSMFFVPLIVWGCVIVKDKHTKGFRKFWLLVVNAVSVIALFCWFGMLVVGVTTVDLWYQNPENGQLEPYFIATTLCAAALFAGYRELSV